MILLDVYFVKYFFLRKILLLSRTVDGARCIPLSFNGSVKAFISVEEIVVKFPVTLLHFRGFPNYSRFIQNFTIKAISYETGYSVR